MFETAELGRKVSKEDFALREPELRTALLRAQDALKDADFPVLILINGVDGAGKGDAGNLLHDWMDARYLKTHAVAVATDEEQQRPDYWRFWMAIPPRGRICIFFGSWYTAPIIQRVFKNIDDAQLAAMLQRVNTFERELVADGALIIKFWFHISKKIQRKRFKKLEKDKETRWRVTKRDWSHHKRFDEFRDICARVLRQTSTGEAPWLVVESSDARYRDLTVAEHVLSRITARLEQEKHAPQPPVAVAAPIASRGAVTILDSLDLSRSLEKKEYERQLEHWQGKLSLLSRRARERQVGAIAIFEGWDAGGKGGCIRRMTRALDARSYHIIPVAAPTDEEQAHHYLWRFWRHLPRLGTITIYDRSWYGRVLVERVEGFATADEWMRAYHEINDFEEQLVGRGIALAKFWLHISPEEQLRRFQEREEKPWKQYKITDEDYRNREKWSEYEAAADEMVERTSTEFAPWTLVEANDKRFARIKVMKTFCAIYETALKSK